MKYLYYCVFHTQKIGTLICIIIALLGCKSVQVNPEWNLFVNALVICGVITVSKYICGGWNAKSLKSMIWAVVISTVVSLSLIIWSVKHGEGSVTFWKWGLPIIVATICGITSGNWAHDLLSGDYADNLDLDGLVGSVFDNGLSNTFNGVMGDLEGQLYYSASRGVAVYSNVLIIIALIITFTSY